MQTETQRFLKILADIEHTEKDRRKQVRTQEKSTVAYRLGTKIFWIGVLTPAVFSLLLSTALWLGAPAWLGYLSIILLALSYVTILLYPFVGAWLYRGKLKAIYRAPFAHLLSLNVENPMLVDSLYLPQLNILEKTTLQLGVIELKSERNSFERRMSLLAGSIEKLGILPGLLALFATLPKLGAQPDWVYAIAYANIPLFLFSILVHMSLIRYDRMIALTELAIQHQDEEAKAAAPAFAEPVLA